MNIIKPCSYHYLFSHIPREKAEKTDTIARDIATPLIETLNLHQENTATLKTPRPDVTPVSHHANDETETYLLQFRSYDVLTTILTLNRTDADENPFSYWKRTLRPNFPACEDPIGQTTILFAQAEPEMVIVREIMDTCFNVTVDEPLPFCRFVWGTLYSLQQPHSTPLHDSLRTDPYILLVPESEELDNGNRFLSYSFAMLESIRHKLVYEERQSRILNDQNETYKDKIKSLLQQIDDRLPQKNPKHSMIKQDLNQVDEYQAELYQNIAKIEALLLTSDINVDNFSRYLEVWPLTEDTLFDPLINRLQVIVRQINVDRQYFQFLLRELDKSEELLRLKIEWQRKEAEERTNKIREVTNALIFSFGVALGIWQFLPTLNLSIHLDITLRIAAIGIGGCLAYTLRRWLGKETLEGAFKEISGGQGTVDNVKKFGE